MDDVTNTLPRQSTQRILEMAQTKRGLSQKKVLFGGDPFGARTQDPNIKSVVLYQLS